VIAKLFAPVAKGKNEPPNTLCRIRAHEVFGDGEAIYRNHGLCQVRKGRSKPGSLAAREDDCRGNSGHVI
jgi:hypothetical protein